MNRKYIIVADDSIKGFEEEIAKLEREWGAEEIEPSEDCIGRQAVLDIWHTTYSNVRIENEEIQYKKIAYELPSVTPQIESSEDCIRREDIFDYIAKLLSGYLYDEERERLEDFTAYIAEMPSVYPERPKGEWIEYEVDVAPHPLHCSLCGFSNHHISNRYMREFRRCPDCGADMSGGGEDEI